MTDNQTPAPDAALVNDQPEAVRAATEPAPVALTGKGWLDAFRHWWQVQQWTAMYKTGKGFPKPPTRRQGLGGVKRDASGTQVYVKRSERRKDKIGTTKLERSLRVRGLVAGHKPARPWVTQASRMHGDALRAAKRAGRTLVEAL